MSRDTTAKYVPHLASRVIGEHPQTDWWYVRMKTNEGEYAILSDAYITKRGAARQMRRIREEMARLWMKQTEGKA